MSWTGLRLCLCRNLGLPLTSNLSFKGSKVLMNTQTRISLCHTTSCRNLVDRTIDTSGSFLPKRGFYSGLTHTLMVKSVLATRKLVSDLTLFNNKRRKSTKKSSRQKKPEYDSDSDTDDEDEEQIQGTKVLNFQMQSLRLDGILKKALGIARNKAEAAFYEGNVRINGEKPQKKSQQLQLGDEIDLIKGVSPMNLELLNVSRIEVLSVKEDNEEDNYLSVRVRRTKTLFIENYQTDPWKKGHVAE